MKNEKGGTWSQRMTIIQYPSKLLMVWTLTKSLTISNASPDVCISYEIVPPLFVFASSQNGAIKKKFVRELGNGTLKNEFHGVRNEIRPFVVTWTMNFEGTKVQNPRRLCHVHCIYTYITRQYAYADKCVSLRGSIRKFGTVLAAYAERYLRHCLTHCSPFE